MAIHYCRHCGAIVPYENARCSSCEQKRLNEKRANATSPIVHNSILTIIAPYLFKLVIAMGIFLIFSALIWVGLFFTFDTYKIDYQIIDEAHRSESQFKQYLLNLDNQREVWEIHCENKNTALLGRIAFWKQNSYTIQYNQGETTPYTKYILNGYDLGSEFIDGTYILTKIDGKQVLIDDQNHLIYPSNTEFFKSYVPILKKLSHDSILNQIIEKVKEGKHGFVEKDPPMEALFNEEAAIHARLVRNDYNVLMDHGFEARIKLGNDEWDLYRFTYYYANDIKDLKLDGYVYAE